MQGVRVRRRTGLSLAEVLIALALFSGALLVIMALFPTASAAAHQGRDLLVAVRLAESEIQRLRSGDFEALASALATVETPWTQQGVAGSTVFTVQVTVAEPAVDLKSLEVAVSWADEAPHLVRLETLVARR